MAFKNLGKLLKKDNKQAMDIKSLLDKESRYGYFLGAIEYALGEAYLENRRFRDKEAIALVKNVRQHYLEDVAFFKTDTEKIILERLSDELRRDRITHHELKLAFDYILWSIDNRSWLNDKQAYVKWNAYNHGMMNNKEYDAYRQEFRKKCLERGIPQEQINAILDNNTDELEVDDKDATRIESEYFSLEGTDKTDFVIKNAMNYPFLIDLQGFSLEEDKKYDEAIFFYTEILKIIPEFPPVECSLALMYEKKGNKVLAEHHLQNAINMLNEMPENILPGEQKTILKSEIEKALKRIKKSGEK